MSSLRDRLIKNTTINTTEVLEKSTIFSDKDLITTSVPIINIAASGRADGGIPPGITMLAGPSKHFKTAFALLIVNAFLTKHKDGVVLFYDSEFGAPLSYFDKFGIPKDQVVHTPITNLEELRHDITVQLKEIKREDHVMIVIDSLGNVASMKEVTDAEDGKSVADMTRAKVMKSLFRIVSPHLTLKNIPCICVNHTYSEIGLYPKEIVSGGTGAYYNSNDIWILGRQQEKSDGEKEIQGYNFIINIEKSRSVREKSRFPVKVMFDSGIYKWSGLFDIARDLGIIKSEKQGWYKVEGATTAKRKSDLEADDGFWEKLIADPEFNAAIEKRYKLT